jgi:hypothetical protein
MPATRCQTKSTQQTCAKSHKQKPDVPPDLREALAFFFAITASTAVVGVDDFLLEAMAINKAIKRQQEFQTSPRSARIHQIYTTMTASGSATGHATLDQLFAVLAILKFAVITYTITRELLVCGGDAACFYSRLQTIVGKTPMYPNIAWFLRSVMTFTRGEEEMFEMERESVNRIVQTTGAYVAATQPSPPTDMTAEHVGKWVVSVMRRSFGGPQSYYTKIEKPLADIL